MWHGALQHFVAASQLTVVLNIFIEYQVLCRKMRQQELIEFFVRMGEQYIVEKNDCLFILYLLQEIRYKKQF